MSELKYPFSYYYENKFRNQPHKNRFTRKSTFRVLSKIILFLIFAYILSIPLFDYLFPNALPNNSRVFKFTASIFVLLWLYPLIGSILALIITGIVLLRTKYTGFFFELCIESEISLSLLLIVYYNINWINDSTSLFLFIIFYGFAIFQYFLLKKPLIYTKPSRVKTFYQLNSNLTSQDLPMKSDILLRQYPFINQYFDGYSSRPAFEDISNIFELSPDRSSLKQQIIRYAKFLSINGDLIGYNYKKDSINLFLRTYFLESKELSHPMKFLKKFMRVLRKRDLTTITFNLETKELHLKLNKFDYDYLNDVTYHLFTERVLKQFKESFILFLQSDYVKSYESVYPTVVKTDATVKGEKIITFIILGYIIGVLLIGPILFYTQQTYAFKLSYYIENAVMWPFMVYIVFSSPGSNLFFNPLILLMCFITIISTVLVFSVINRFKWKEIDSNYKGLKIPSNLKNKN